MLLKSWAQKMLHRRESDENSVKLKIDRGKYEDLIVLDLVSKAQKEIMYWIRISFVGVVFIAGILWYTLNVVVTSKVGAEVRKEIKKREKVIESFTHGMIKKSLIDVTNALADMKQKIAELEDIKESLKQESDEATIEYVAYKKKIVELKQEMEDLNSVVEDRFKRVRQYLETNVGKTLELRVNSKPDKQPIIRLWKTKPNQKQQLNVIARILRGSIYKYKVYIEEKPQFCSMPHIIGGKKTKQFEVDIRNLLAVYEDDADDSNMKFQMRFNGRKIIRPGDCFNNKSLDEEREIHITFGDLLN